MRLRGLLFVPLLFSCGPDPEPLECHGGPDFAVLVSAKDMPLPADTVLKLYYGARAPGDPEVLTLADPMTPQALFCYRADRQGNYDHGAPALGAKSSSMASPTEGAGAGGEGGAGSDAYEALLCDLYTDGSARLEAVTLLYGKSELELAPKKNVCTVQSKLLLEPTDAGS